LQNDTATFNDAKSFLVTVIKTLEPQGGRRNEDSICRIFVPLDTLKDRTERSGCNIETNHLNTNSIAFEDFIYRIDSSCTRNTEKNTIYFRVNLASKDPVKHGNQKPFVSGYVWYKIWFDGKKYWLIPGHHNIDVCIDFLWMPVQGGMFYYTREMAPWDKYKKTISKY
jgi:hypothetical protein